METGPGRDHCRLGERRGREEALSAGLESAEALPSHYTATKVTIGYEFDVQAGVRYRAMRTAALALLVVLAGVLASPPAEAHGRSRVHIGLGFGYWGPYWGPWYYPPPYYYYPPAVVVREPV